MKEMEKKTALTDKIEEALEKAAEGDSQLAMMYEE